MDFALQEYLAAASAVGAGCSVLLLRRPWVWGGEWLDTVERAFPRRHRWLFYDSKLQNLLESGQYSWHQGEEM